MMSLWQISSLSLLGFFYLLYFSKALIQFVNGIRTNLTCKGKNLKENFFDLLMLFSTISVAIVEFFSIIRNSSGFKPMGIALQTCSVIIFAVALVTMKNSWRVGFSEEQDTALITNGIFSLSRNPAFLAFDLTYIGILIGYYNLYNLFFSVLAVSVLHFQILREEKYLMNKFDENYKTYYDKTGRYLTFRQILTKR